MARITLRLNAALGVIQVHRFNMSIIQNNSFNIPLYHGTTSLFIDSIKQHGLGAIDPLNNMKAKDLMQAFFSLADKQNWKDSEWLNARAKLEPLLNQTKNQHYNFMHGGTYLTYSPELAKRYAIENPFGCEYLYYLRILFAILANRKVNEVKQFFEHPVFKAWEKPNDPYLIQVDGLKLSSVETEIETDLNRQLNIIEANLRNGQCDARSFKLTDIVSPENLIITSIGKWNESGTQLIETV
ncbi:TPA: hypothetical protein NKA51_004520 [Vibrio parahaemolyticus]|uniref:hypothetical protein n=4 Tax=Vibrio parahaemolyticus TaxID=670 RepID=UPI0007AD7553|nr:hypothetical protein [Vibrio parahaemolyticus]KYY06941.1 hypothetical protein AVR64_15290 [Vibrio parahaemolyticus]HCE2504988.1 hypothetical protein [Vibrio parahaemolyticus]HCG7030543.1 hypothetical protein [Vibrio parahaemolyticus]HCG7503001.1 hypothetical protein [Vibrio parahaemolyticus]HCG8233385.1 hypothetical protein [Vibrio parahaemolyticus]